MTASGEAEDGWDRGTMDVLIDGYGPARRRGGLVEEGPWEGGGRRGAFSMAEDKKGADANAWSRSGDG